MKKDTEKTEKFDAVVIVCVIALCVFAVCASLASLFSAGSRIDPDSYKTTDLSLGWRDDNGIVLSVGGILDSNKNYSDTKPLYAYKKASELKDKEMIYLHSRNLVVNIYMDDTPIHITGTGGSLEGLNGFDNYVFVCLPTEGNYENLKLEIYKTRYSAQSGIGSIMGGSEKSIIRKLLGENIIPIVCAVIFIVIGIGLIIFGVFTRKKVESYLSSVYYGIFLVAMALGSVFDTSWAHIVSDNYIHTETSQRIFLCAAFPAFLAFVDKFFITEHTYPVKIIEILSFIMFPVMLIMNNAGIISFIDVGTYYLLFVAFCGLVIFEELFVFMIKTRGARSLRSMRDYISVYVFIGCCIIDIIGFISMPVGNDDMFFSRIGLIVMSSVTILSWFGEILEMIKLGVQAGRIGKIAFTDANTGIGNVAAFKAEFDDLEAKKLTCRYIGIVQFDVNNLKVINDSKGHEAGDLLIKSAADIINNSFGTIGNCYRTGGDEFVALIVDDHAPIACEEAIYKFNKLIDKFNNNENKPFELRIAFGIGYYQNDKTTNATLKEIHKIADERMYENKKMLKARYAKTPEEAVIR